MAMAFEMFPRRVQPALDAWVAGALDADSFLEQAEWRAVWNFAPDLYWPLFHFCRQFKVPMLAVNCRRALVTEVARWAGMRSRWTTGRRDARQGRVRRLSQISVRNSLEYAGARCELYDQP